MCTNKNLIWAQSPEDIKKNMWKYPKMYINPIMKGHGVKQFVKCGQCYECKKERARNWTYKIWLEAMNHKEKCFLTLTYADDYDGKRQLSKQDLVKFIKRLRKKIDTPIKYFGAGEYGEKKGRAHYHVIILGWQPKDLKKIHSRKSKKGKDMYKSRFIHETWGHGICTVQPFALNEIGYLTLYINHNKTINRKANGEVIADKKRALNKLKVKHGLMIFDKNAKDIEKPYVKVKKIKDLKPEELKAYKKEYYELQKQFELKQEPEFNLMSNNIGFDTYIEKNFWKHDLIINGMTFERPREYLRKIIDNMDEYPSEIVDATINELLKRKKYVDEKYPEIENMEQWQKYVKEEETQQRIQEAKNFKKIKLYREVGKHEEVF